MKLNEMMLRVIFVKNMDFPDFSYFRSFFKELSFHWSRSVDKWKILEGFGIFSQKNPHQAEEKFYLKMKFRPPNPPSYVKNLSHCRLIHIFACLSDIKYNLHIIIKHSWKNHTNLSNMWVIFIGIILWGTFIYENKS